MIISCPGRESGAGEVGLRQERTQWRCGEGRPATTVRGEIPSDRERFQESHANENLHELRTSLGNIHNWGMGELVCVCVCTCTRACVCMRACEGIPPSNTDMKQHFPSLIINTKQTTCARTHTVKLPGKLIIHPMNNDTLTQ